MYRKVIIVCLIFSLLNNLTVVLKAERMQKRRLEAFLKTKDPKVEFDLPELNPKFDMKGIEFTFSVNTGIQWKVM